MGQKYNQYDIHPKLIWLLCIHFLFIIFVMPVYAPISEKTFSPDSNHILFSQKEAKWIREHPVIKLSADNNNPPMNFINRKGELTGISIEYLKLIAEKIGITIEFKGSTWDKALKKALNHEVDGIINAAVKEDRKPYLNFTIPYFNTGLALITQKDSEPISNLSEFCGKSVAIVRGSVRNEIIRRHCPGTRVFEVDNILHGLKLVSEGKSDAMFDDLPVMQYSIEKHFFSNLKVALLYYSPSGESRIGLRNDSLELLSVFNKAMASITDAEHRAIKMQWLHLGENVHIQNAPLLSPAEEEWIATHPVIRVGIDPGWAPIEYRDDKGQFQGISVAYLRYVEKKLNIKFLFSETTEWKDMVDLAKQRKLDMLSAISKTHERKSFLSFTQPYFSSPIVIFTGKDVAYVSNLKELAGKKVGVVDGFAIHEWLSADYPGIQVAPVSSVPEALMKLHKGEIHAFAGNLVTGSYHISKLGYSTLKVAGETEYTNPLAFGIRKDWPMFANILRKTLDDIPENEKNTIYQNWASIQYVHRFDYKLLFRIIFAFLLIMLLFLYWNRRLSTEVTERKTVAAALRKNEERLLIASEAGNLGMWDWDFKLDKIYCNDEFLEISGLTREEVETFSFEFWLDHLHPDDRNITKKIIQSALKGETNRLENEIRYNHPKKGWIWLHGNACAIERDADGNLTRLVGVHRDITHRKKAETERENLIQDLKKALSEIETLSGLVPICASCKKIRDDKGYWNQIESYIQQHSKAKFSHGICPECSDKLYGDQDWYKDMKKKQ